MAIVVTMADTVPGRDVAEVVATVRGNVVRARFVGRDLLAGLRSIVGGEVPEYTKLLAEAREQAYDRMIAQAEEAGADAVISFRFATSTVMQGMAEILAYGTAVKLR